MVRVCMYVCMFLVMDTSTDKQHYKCKILSHYNMENISVSTLVFRSSKRKGKLLFFQIEKSKKKLAKWIDLPHIYFKKPTHSDFHYDPIPKSWYSHPSLPSVCVCEREQSWVELLRFPLLYYYYYMFEFRQGTLLCRVIYYPSLPVSIPIWEHRDRAN